MLRPINSRDWCRPTFTVGYLPRETSGRAERCPKTVITSDNSQTWQSFCQAVVCLRSADKNGRFYGLGRTYISCICLIRTEVPFIRKISNNVRAASAQRARPTLSGARGKISFLVWWRDCPWGRRTCSKVMKYVSRSIEGEQSRSGTLLRSLSKLGKVVSERSAASFSVIM